MHLNILKKNETKVEYWIRNIKWVPLGVLIPELVVLAAWRQWLSARHMTIEIKRIVGEEIKNEEVDIEMNPLKVSILFHLCYTHPNVNRNPCPKNQAACHEDIPGQKYRASMLEWVDLFSIWTSYHKAKMLIYLLDPASRSQPPACSFSQSAEPSPTSHYPTSKTKTRQTASPKPWSVFKQAGWFSNNRATRVA